MSLDEYEKSYGVQKPKLEDPKPKEETKPKTRRLSIGDYEKEYPDEGIVTDILGEVEEFKEAPLQKTGEYIDAVAGKPFRAMFEGVKSGVKSEAFDPILGTDTPRRGASTALALGKGLYRGVEYPLRYVFGDYDPPETKEILQDWPFEIDNPNLAQEMMFDFSSDPAMVKAMGKAALKGAAKFPGLGVPFAVGLGTAEGLKKVKDFYTRASKPVPTPQYKKLAATAEKIGIPKGDLPKSVEYGEESFHSALERAQMDMTDYARKEVLENTYNLTNEYIQNVARKFGRSEGLADFGAKLRSFIKDEKKKLFFNDAPLYRKIANDPSYAYARISDEAMDAVFSTVDDIKDQIEKETRISSLNDKPIHARALAELDMTIKNLELAGDNFPAMVDVLQSVGRDYKRATTARKANQLDPQLKYMEDHYLTLYRQVREAILDGVADINPDEAQELMKNNKKVSNFLRSLEKMTKEGNMEVPDLVLANKFIKSAMSDNLGLFDKVVGPEMMGEAKAAWLMDKVLRPDRSLLSQGKFQISPKSATRAMGNSYNQEVLSKFFDIGELEQLEDGISLLNSYGPLRFNFSNTARLEAMANTMKFISQATQLSMIDSVLKNSVAGGNTPLDKLIRAGWKGGEFVGKLAIGGSINPMKKDFLFPTFRTFIKQFKEDDKGNILGYRVDPQEAPLFEKVIKSDRSLGTVEKMERLQHLKEGLYFFAFDPKKDFKVNKDVKETKKPEFKKFDEKMGG